MTINTEILRSLNEAVFVGLEGERMNMADISIQKRSYYIVRDITIDDVDLAIKRITFFIFADTENKPGEYIHRLILNRSPDINTRLERMIATCIYLLPMIGLGRLTRDDYIKVYRSLLRKVELELTNSDYDEFKDVINYYDSNVGQLGILSYLY